MKWFALRSESARGPTAPDSLLACVRPPPRAPCHTLADVFAAQASAAPSSSGRWCQPPASPRPWTPCVQTRSWATPWRFFSNEAAAAAAAAAVAAPPMAAMRRRTHQECSIRDYLSSDAGRHCSEQSSMQEPFLKLEWACYLHHKRQSGPSLLGVPAVQDRSRKHPAGQLQLPAHARCHGWPNPARRFHMQRQLQGLFVGIITRILRLVHRYNTVVCKRARVTRHCASEGAAMGLFGKKSVDTGPLDKAGIVQLAQKGEGLEAVVVQDDEIDLPWHAVPDAKDVVEDLASDAAEGLTGGECHDGRHGACAMAHHPTRRPAWLIPWSTAAAPHMCCSPFAQSTRPMMGGCAMLQTTALIERTEILL